MLQYHEAKADDDFDYGVLTYLDADDEAVTAEGYLAGDVLGGTDEPVAVVAEPERTIQVPFRRVVRIRYPTGE
ncbi:hypothetical protein [Halorarum salinum]|uniref:Uncharacterized protein n=1 Tax=Halorarum salinum TaxID=2743089 RepID=A0A7D5L955_9EURY|nr:hypothetical protein [Halobaculum salinum]QLG61133.1 hypothetical protein HUG12_05040 [Halobaculum salinum]